jgi:hypothetical protein
LGLAEAVSQKPSFLNNAHYTIQSFQRLTPCELDFADNNHSLAETKAKAEGMGQTAMSE